MSYTPTYKAANNAAASIEHHFNYLHHTATALGEKELAAQPSTDQIEYMIDVAFWTSLRQEEGHLPKISIAFLSPNQTAHPLVFEQPLAFNADTVSKIAPGLERAGIHLGVWYEGDELYIWGSTLNIPNFCFVVDVSEPGVIVVKHRRVYGIGKYTNVAVLKGEQIRIVDENSCVGRDCPPVLRALLDLTVNASWNDPVNILIQFAASMRAHRRGGALLIVPRNDVEWKHSIIHPINYMTKTAFTGLSLLAIQGGQPFRPCLLKVRFGAR